MSCPAPILCVCVVHNVWVWSHYELPHLHPELEILCCVVHRVWDSSAHSAIVSCPAPHPVRSLSFSPDGTLLAAGMQDGSFSVYTARYPPHTHCVCMSNVQQDRYVCILCVRVLGSELYLGTETQP